MQELIDYLCPLITERKWDLFNKIIANRTRYITVALEDIYQPQNASAVLRTCDCFGIQDVHIIENENQYTINPKVALGASKWLNLKRYNELSNNTLQAIQELRNKGYRIVATTPHTNDTELSEFDLSKGKFALFFGSEKPGLSQIVMDNADEFLKIPMYGFTESFNISVSASIILHHLVYKLKNSNIHTELSKSEQQEILLNWLRVSIKNSEMIEKEFYKKMRNKN